MQQYDDKKFDDYVLQIIKQRSAELMQNYQLSGDSELAQTVCRTVFEVIRLGMQIVDACGKP